MTHMLSHYLALQQVTKLRERDCHLLPSPSHWGLPGHQFITCYYNTFVPIMSILNLDIISITMSTDALIEFLQSPSKLVSEKNAIRIQTNIVTQPGRQIVAIFIDNNLIENVEQSQVQKCVVCYNICVFPIIIPCGHLMCGNCYVRHFKFNHCKRFDTYYTQCPHCTSSSNIRMH